MGEKGIIPFLFINKKYISFPLRSRVVCFTREDLNVIPETTSNMLHATAAAKSLQSCSILCYPIDSSPPGSPIPVIL